VVSQRRERHRGTDPETNPFHRRPLMAATSYGVNDPLAIKLWSKKLSVEVLKATWLSKFMGNTCELHHPDQG
jgi:hypothetical protein